MLQDCSFQQSAFSCCSLDSPAFAVLAWVARALNTWLLVLNWDSIACFKGLRGNICLGLWAATCMVYCVTCAACGGGCCNREVYMRSACAVLRSFHIELRNERHFCVTSLIMFLCIHFRSRFYGILTLCLMGIVRCVAWKSPPEAGCDYLGLANSLGLTPDIFHGRNVANCHISNKQLFFLAEHV